MKHEDFIFLDNWSSIYLDPTPVIGHRLGVDYLRAANSVLTINVCGDSFTFSQSQSDDLSGVVWDAGLILIDFLSNYSINFVEGCTVLDLGCGVGAVGLVAARCGASSLVLSDCNWCQSLQDNISCHSSSYQSMVTFSKYLWGNPLPPELSQTFDTVLCSDVLYDKTVLLPLITTLRALRFTTLLLAYKRRHDEPERECLQTLSTFFHIQVVSGESIALHNLKPMQTAAIDIPAYYSHRLLRVPNSDIKFP
eukprot:gene6686-13546_t